jgi:hypothetical protein
VHAMMRIWHGTSSPEILCPAQECATYCEAQSTYEVRISGGSGSLVWGSMSSPGGPWTAISPHANQFRHRVSSLSSLEWTTASTSYQCHTFHTSDTPNAVFKEGSGLIGEGRTRKKKSKPMTWKRKQGWDAESPPMRGRLLVETLKF